MVDLTRSPVGVTIFKLALPVSIGIAANMSYNIADTYFIGKLGQNELEAVSFTFPIILALLQIAIGFGIGVTSVISRSVGRGEDHREGYLTSASLILIVVLAGVFCLLGIISIQPLFQLLGAPSELLPSITLYLNFLYPAMAIQMIMMVAANIFRAYGDTLKPSIIMVGAAAVNTALDPILIFGFGPVPALGLYGAGLASLIGNLLSCSAILWLLFASKLCAIVGISISVIKDAWLKIIAIGIPAAASNVVNPIAFSVVTSILATYGAATVAGYGVAARIEAFATIPMLAMTAGLSPFIGQNYGRGQYQRLIIAAKLCIYFTLIYVSVSAVGFGIFASELASLFTRDPQSTQFIVDYYRYIPLTLIDYGVLIIVCACFNAIGTPIPSLWLTSIRMLGLYVPLSWLGSSLFGITGVIAAIATANIAAGLLAYYMARRQIFSLQEDDS